MLQIAICDDDIHELSLISNLMESYRSKKNAVLTYKLFHNGIDFLHNTKGGDYDIILLDIFLPGINGIEIAREIRSFDREVKIIFLTSSPEFAAESYTVDAYYYLLKPCTEERISPILDKLFLATQKITDSLIIKLQSSIVRVPFEELEFVEIVNKKLLFHLTDNKIIEISGTLSFYEKELIARSEFIKVHRSYIVNMHWIYKMDAKEVITYNKKSIPISRLLYSQVRTSYMKYLFVERGIE